jgi:hypothetical protein
LVATEQKDRKRPLGEMAGAQLPRLASRPLELRLPGLVLPLARSLRKTCSSFSSRTKRCRLSAWDTNAINRPSAVGSPLKLKSNGLLEWKSEADGAPLKKLRETAK